MKRLCVFVIYDEEGKIYEYVEYYLREIKSIASDIIIISNGKLREDGKAILYKYTSRVLERENIGYDAAAYKEVFEKHLSYEELVGYDELILANDTCFGPFESFESIFVKMQEKKCDFWGLAYCENGFLSHLQSYFLVFRKLAFDDLIDYFKLLPYTYEVKIDLLKFENGLFYFLKNKGYTYSYYTNIGALNIYKYPDSAITQKGVPILKKRSFKEQNNWTNCKKALLIIDKKYNYNVNFIKEYVKEKYEFYEDSILGDEEIIVKKNVAKSEEEVMDFISKNENIYIFGAGNFGKIVAWLCRDYKNIKGVVVSDKADNPEEVFDLKVYTISEIENKSLGIIVALNKENALQVKDILKVFDNVLYLCE